jgi:hypothetical protein
MKQYMFRTRVWIFKTFQIDILGQRQIETSIDVVLKEEIAFQRSKESQMEIDSETMPSPPSAVQREKNIIPTDPVAPVDMFRDQKENL